MKAPFLIRPLAAAVSTLCAGGASAQQGNAPPGSPAATTTIPGDQLPPPPQKFGGVIKDTAQQSTPYWPARVVPPKGAPNVLVIMTDDAGYGVAGTFGGVIPTPALDRIAQAGLRYTNFHSTALSSPTRAALITGRNHHSAGFGVVSEQATGFPGYDSFIPKDKATIGRILRDHGYATSWFGKDHNTPEFQASQAGPFDQWPIGMGFEYFYGFVGGDTNQWQPNLFRNTTQIYPFQGQPRGTWNLTTAMADDAINYMTRMNELTPDKPFFVYYVPGGTHAPHHPTKEWTDRISAMHLFDQGWNKLRETIFANQKRLGVIPPNARLTPWPKELKQWDQLGADEKKLFIRQADVFGAYVAYTDHEIGRVIQAVQDMGKLDNTLIIYIEGDNGTSAEGQMNGTPNEIAMFNGANPSVADQLKYFYDVWGTDKTYNHMAVPWAWAFDTPFSWTKQIASHFGGTRQGMAISWPAVIKDRGGIRNQFHHVIDIVPTILEATRIRAPRTVDGIAQSPVEGVSMAYTFDARNANAPSKHTTQYFEMFGDRAIYHDGWIASTKVMRAPWDVTAQPKNPFSYPWELYNLHDDWTQADDVAAKYPQKLKELQALFMQEAKKYQVLPLDTSVVARAIAPRPSITAGRSTFAWTRPITGIPNGDAPSVLNASYKFTAEVDIPQGGGEGMLITQGGRFAGYGFYILKNKPVFLWNLVDLERVKWEGADALTPGHHTLEFEFRYEGMGAGTMAFGSNAGLGKGGTGVLRVDGKDVASRKMAHSLPFLLQFDESLDVGSDTLTGVNDADYQPPFAFNGKITKITLSIDRPKLSPDDIKKLQAAERAKAASSTDQQGKTMSRDPKALPAGLHVLAKPIGPVCDIKCDYCFYLEKRGLFAKNEQYRMSDEVLARYIAQYVDAQPTPVCEFVWHGGEPTLLGLDFFRRVVALQAPYRSRKEIRNTLQTNAMRLDDAWCGFFREHGFFVGVSLDGPKDIHDVYRKDRRGRGTFERVMQGVRRLQRHGVEFNALACVGRHTAHHPLEAYRFFKEVGIDFIQFTPIVEREPAEGEFDLMALWLAGPAALDHPEPNTRVTPWTVEPERYGDFLIAIYEEWVRKDVGKVFVMNFEWALNAWLGNGSPVCIFSRQCGRAVALEHDGSVFACDHYVYPEYRLGNVMRDGLRDMVEASVQSGFGPHKEATLPAYCRRCEVLEACWGGCPKHRFAVTPDGEPGLHYLCAGYKKFFRHIRKYQHAMTQLLGAGLPVSLVMEAIDQPLLVKLDEGRIGAPAQAAHTAKGRKEAP